MKRTPQLFASLLLTLAVTGAYCAPSMAQPQVGALSNRGVVYKAQVGNIGKLFPQATATLHDNTGIVLEIKHSDQETEWQLVPSTEGIEVESAPFLLVEGRTNGVHLIWESSRNYIYSRINMASYVDGTWSEVIELSGELFSQKSAPRIAVTRDSYQELDPESGVEVTYHLTNFHTVWFEDASQGRQAVYSLVQFRNGIFQAPNQVFVLGDFDSSGNGDLTTDLNSLLESPTVVTGRDDEHAVAAFANPENGRLATIDFAIVPYAIVGLAEKIRSEIVDIGQSSWSKDTLAVEVGAQLLANGQEIHPDFLNYIGLAIADTVLGTQPETSIIQLSEKIRSEIIDIGARLTVLGKNDFTEASEITTVEIPAAQEGGLPSILLARVGSSRLAPEIGEGLVTLYPTPDGNGLIVAWQAESALYYQEDDGTSWSEVRTLRLDKDLDLTAAHQLLERRARGR